ncbi:MAG: hypothetical protein A3K12_04675 [Candidatus Rokubacteria bacterium RIFCSPLOWO2_12_FULL_71_19]|nr:MAG: hypothetical protein A3K12_04675 [Candidatus Rokubacteria bacterium RIFCSPLOWO2_12_FULL_71_19]
MVTRTPAADVGDPAPDFSLPSVNRDGVVGLADYRGRTPVFLGLYRGLHCPFCRRHLAQLDLTREKLEQIVARHGTQLAGQRASAIKRLLRHGGRLPAV